MNNAMELIRYSDIILSCFIPGQMLTESRIASHALVFVRSGVMEAKSAGRKFTVPAGGFVFLKRDHAVRIRKQSDGARPYSAMSILLQRNFLRDSFRTLNPRNFPRAAKRFEEAVIPLRSEPALESLFASLLPYTDARVKPLPEWIELKEREALLCLLTISPRFYPTLFDFSSPWKIDLLAFMEANFREDLTLEEFASYTGRSLATFKRDFAKISPLTPEKWLLEKRLDYAHRLLTEDHRKISDVYLEAGFRNRSHFSTAFRKKYGVTPAEAGREPESVSF